jgi:hypothetical protein
MAETESMTRRGQSVLFATLLLVAQLLFGVLSGAATAHAGAPHCNGCPSSHSSTVPDHMGGAHGGSHCGDHCNQPGSTGSGHSHCGSGCALHSSGHCGSPASPAASPTASISQVDVTGSYGSDRRTVVLPDSPLFDFLRPPTRA